MNADRTILIASAKLTTGLGISAHNNFAVFGTANTGADKCDQVVGSVS
jgi:hypothetical protein